MEIDQIDPLARPFLKWAGGKRTLLSRIIPMIPEISGSYIEPFVGAGAVMLAIPTRVPKIANDFNEELIGTYRSIQNHLEELLQALKKHKNSEEYFYKVRDWDRKPDFADRTEIEKAARFIFLNKTCFNGLYRVNSSGQFNVPFASYKNPEIFSVQHLERISEILNGYDIHGSKVSQKVKLSSGDFRNITSQAKRGDFVYFDPPYDPLTSTSSFVSYQKEGFSRQDQIDLRDEMVRLTRLGVKIILSNSDTNFVRKLYREPKLFKIQSVQVQRAISASSSSRIKVGEVLVRNY